MGITGSSVSRVLNSTRFPLSISSSGRYFVDRQGKPFYWLMDAAWSACGNLTLSQIDQYLRDRAARGFTAIVVEFANMLYSNQQPTYRNPDGDDPFTTIASTGSPNWTCSSCDFSTANPAYFTKPDYLVQRALALGIMVVAFPAYSGFPAASPEQGWYTPMSAATGAQLQAYGAFLARRYGNYPNILWGLAGDRSLGSADMTLDWNIVTGMRSVRTDQLIYAKGQRNTSGWSLLTSDGGIASYPGFNVNNAYVSNSNGAYTMATDCASEYGRSPVYPFFVDETDYEGYSTVTAADVRRGLIAPRLSGACGDCFGNYTVWAFGGANNGNTIGAAASLTDTYLNSGGALSAQIWASLLRGYPWWLLAPKTDASLVSTSLGTGPSTICPALASDGSCALIYFCNGGSATVVMTNFTHTPVRARWWDPVSGAFTAIGTFANSGTQSFTAPTNSGGDADFVLVLD